MRNRIALIIAVVTLALIALGTAFPPRMTQLTWMAVDHLRFSSPATPEGAVQRLLEQVQRRDYSAAYSELANTNELEAHVFESQLAGTHRSLRTFAALERFNVQRLESADNAARVRADLRWATVVGPFEESQEFDLVQDGGRWKVSWPVPSETRVPPQVIPVNYLRWDVVYRGPSDGWGIQDVEAPHVRIVAMNPISTSDGVVILGELLNDDTVPAFATVSATLLGADGNELARRTTFDLMSHTLLPRQVTPFRIDFPGVRLEQIDSVRMQPTASLVPASADPIVVVQDQRLQKSGESAALQGALVNESGIVVNIPHVLATFYDNQGQIIWVSNGYVAEALLPRTPVPFSVEVPQQVAAQTSSYRVIVNPYSADRLK